MKNKESKKIPPCYHYQQQDESSHIIAMLLDLGCLKTWARDCLALICMILFVTGLSVLGFGFFGGN